MRGVASFGSIDSCYPTQRLGFGAAFLEPRVAAFGYLGADRPDPLQPQRGCVVHGLIGHPRQRDDVAICLHAEMLDSG